LYYRFDSHQRRIVAHYPKKRNLQWGAIPKADAVLSLGPKNDLIFIRGEEAFMVNQTSSGSTRVIEGYPRELWSLFEYCRWKEGIVDIPAKRETSHHHHHNHDHHHRALRHKEESSFAFSPNPFIIVTLIVFLIS
ncbi:hypothetical protein PFISCL1PPCAC_9724, partial [Pristionchus fissidentatus]